MKKSAPYYLSDLKLAKAAFSAALALVVFGAGALQ